MHTIHWSSKSGDQGHISWKGAGFTPAQADLLTRDLAWLRAALVTVNDDLSAYGANPAVEAAVERWFGAGITRDQVSQVVRTVSAVTRAMDSKVLHFRNEAVPGYAWQILKNKIPLIPFLRIPLIVFGSDYWSLSASHGRSYRFGVLIHELTHCFPQTGDWAYYGYNPTTMLPIPNAFRDLSAASAEQIRGEGPARFVPNTQANWLGFKDTPEWRIKTADSYAGFLREFYTAGIPDER